jgi:predicted NUDIX family NTP pyrophosphohydrolase
MAPRSAAVGTLPEMDRAGWFGIADARRPILKDRRLIDDLRARWQFARDNR